MAFFDGHKTEEVTLENSALYEGELGASVIALECMQFEAELFEEAVRADVAEYSMIQEGTDTKVFVEGKLAEVKQKVIKFLETLLAKIKAAFKGFVDKFVSVVIRDNKALYTKFKDQVAKKDLSGLKVQYGKLNATMPTKNPNIRDYIKEDNKDKTVEELKLQIFEDLTTLKIEKSSDMRSKYAAFLVGEVTEKTYPEIAKTVEGDLAGADWAKANKDLATIVETNTKAAIVEVKKESTEENSALVSKVCTAYAAVMSALAWACIDASKKQVSLARKAFQKAVAYKPVKEGEEFNEDLFLVECDLVEVEPEA